MQEHAINTGAAAATRDSELDRGPLVQLAVVAALLTILTALAAGALESKSLDRFTLLHLAHAAAYAVGVTLVLRRRFDRRAVWLVLAVGLLLRGLALTAPPALTTDANRYIWDGRVQAAGINPYLYVPADPALAHLRDATVYPHINRKETYPTIYPPMAELLFFLAERLGGGLAVLRGLMLACECLIMALTLAWLTRDGVPRERILIYAWHPLAIWELTAMAHVDAAAIMLSMLAVVAAVRHRQGLAGGALMAAGLVKYHFLLLAPALWRRWDWRMPLAMAATGAALYAIYVPGAGLKVIGSLFQHLDEEGYRDGYGYYLVGMPRHLGWPYLQPRAFSILAAIVMLLAGTLIALRAARDVVRPEHLVVLTALFFVLVSPHYPWYYALAVPLLCRRMSLALLFMTLVVSAVYLERPDGWLEPFSRIKVFTTMFVGAGGIALGEWLVARRRRAVASSRP